MEYSRKLAATDYFILEMNELSLKKKKVKHRSYRNCQMLGTKRCELTERSPRSSMNLLKHCIEILYIPINIPIKYFFIKQYFKYPESM